MRGNHVHLFKNKTRISRMSQKKQSAPPKEKGKEQPAPPQELSSEEIIAQCEKAVALIETPVGHGTGFVVRPGLVATNAHVVGIATTDNLKVYFPSAGEVGKKPLPVYRIAQFDRKRDLAVLEVKTDLPPLKLAENYQFKRGRSIIVIGNPGLGRGLFKLENAVAKGIASSEVNLPSGRFFQLNVAVNPGNSGGPVLDPTGQVMGMVQSRAIYEEGIALAVPVDELVNAAEAAVRISAHEKDLLTSQFNARTVFLRAAKAASVFGDGTHYLEKPWQDALQRSGNVQSSDLTASRNQFLSLVKNRNQEYLLELRDVEKAMTTVGTDPNLTETTRQRIADLWQVCDAFRLDFFTPVGNLIQYQDRCEKNRRRLEELTASLRVTLGVEQEELNIISVLSK
jgi:S1-C subfamily serine protease